MKDIKNIDQEDLAVLSEMLLGEVDENMFASIQVDITDNFGSPQYVASWKTMFKVTGYLLSKGYNLFHY